MGQKVNPHGLRVGVIKNWDTSWFASKKDFSKYLAEDYKIREFIKRKCYQYGISKIEIERAQGKIIINILTSKPGMIIGQKGVGVEVLKKDLTKIVKENSIHLNILEVKRPDLDSILVAESIAAQLEKRASFKRTMKQTLTRVMRAGAKGVKLMLAGRLDGAEIARSVHYHEGSIPLQTIRADIDYGTAEAHTTFGIIGVKVWIYKGEVLGKPTISERNDERQQEQRQNSNRNDRKENKPRPPKDNHIEKADTNANVAKIDTKDSKSTQTSKEKTKKDKPEVVKTETKEKDSAKPEKAVEKKEAKTDN